MNKTRTSLREIVARIEPVDERERVDRARVLAWIDGEAELYRRQKPDVPAQHLVSYVAVVDRARELVLLLDHVKADLWVPAGGHVEPNEDPHDTAKRELAEELGSRAAMVATVASLPLFITVTQTRGAGQHTDVSLWYVVAGDKQMWLEPDQREFRGHCWLSYDEVLQRDLDQLDPEMHRFMHKLRGRM
jgi:8-oxo-dGTP pyrophosphatase MutT (NUDIX family)